MNLRITQYGFSEDSPSYEVIRMCEHKGYKFLHIKTNKEILTIRITPKGKIRCWKEDKNGKLMKGEIR